MVRKTYHPAPYLIDRKEKKHMIDWKRKLTSRKFWAAVCTFVTNMIIAFGGTDDTAVKVTALIVSGAAVVAYIVGEGLVDANNAGYVEIDYPPEETTGKE